VNTDGLVRKKAGPVFVLEEALSLHQEGKLGEAAALYRKILAQYPDNADALHLLGVIEFQRESARAA
jgi:Flp pilus assembly protein TadD